MKTKIKTKISYAAFVIVAFFVFASQIKSAAINDVVINEIAWMGTIISSNDEWIELYNNTGADIDLTGWTLNSTDGTPSINLSGTISANGYFLLERTDDSSVPDVLANQIYTGALANSPSGENLELRDSANNLIDSLDCSGGWFAGDNTTKQTMERKNPLNPGNDSSNWQTSALVGGTPKAASSAGSAEEDEEDPPPEEPAAPVETTAPSTQSGSATAAPVADPKKIKITEIFPNPKTSEETSEFIEIWNNNDASITLDRWKISDTSKVITIEKITLVPGEYKALYRTETKIALNNGSETIYLYDSDGNLIDEISYSSTIEAYSLARDPKQDKFLWTSTQTPSQANEFTIPNDPPTAAITFSNNPVAPGEIFTIYGTDSTDPNNDPLSYFWKIGDKFQASGEQFKYSFNDIGSYLIYLRISDSKHEAIATATIDVISAVDVVSLRIISHEKSAIASNSISRTSSASLFINGQAATTGQIFINEIFPNPKGADDEEWLELYNPNDFSVILDDWTIDDQEGGSKPYMIKDRVISAKSYIALGKEETKITLNNTSDEVRLFDKSGALIDEALFDDVVEEKSYAKTDENEWLWTENITKAQENSAIKAYDSPEPAYSADAITYSFQDIGEELVDIDLANIRELEIGAQVRVQGTVAVEPGVLGKTYFYITGSPGIQVYFYKKDWPEIKIGDVVGVIGEISEINGEARLKIASKDDIILL